MSYYGSRTTWWSVLLKILFIAGVYVFGVFSASWWTQKVYDTRLEIASKIMPKDSLVTNDTIIFSGDTVTVKAAVSESGVKTEVNVSENIEELCVPFTEDNGAIYLTVDIHGCKVKAVYDTGCNTTIVFAPKDYYKLVGAGAVKEDEFTSTSLAGTASGGMMGVKHFNLDRIEIGNIVFEDQAVAVGTSGDQTLVGLTLWKDYKTSTVDHERKCLVFTK